ncbi:unnamed protein product [Arabis nemorensis]|uniref:Uncharacterized protein n=1 Tax=Arabis nemorensis TaxID=586526 RepID=A0A565CSN0_9BRAS|nr:unnamed protein product [Arabis nemorensis]
MATSRLNAFCRVSASRSLNCESYVGLRARTVTISYCRTLTAPRCPLVRRANEGRTLVVNAVAETEEGPKKRYPGEAKGFVEEMRFVAMRMHTRIRQRKDKKSPKLPRTVLSRHGNSQWKDT